MLKATACTAPGRGPLGRCAKVAKEIVFWRFQTPPMALTACAKKNLGGTLWRRRCHAPPDPGSPTRRRSSRNHRQPHRGTRPIITRGKERERPTRTESSGPFLSHFAPRQTHLFFMYPFFMSLDRPSEAVANLESNDVGHATKKGKGQGKGKRLCEGESSGKRQNKRSPTDSTHWRLPPRRRVRWGGQAYPRSCGRLAR